MKKEPLSVTIVSDKPETLDGLRVYLRQAGVDAHGTRQLDTTESGGLAPSAVVFFPDEFGIDDVVCEVTRLRRERPHVVSVIVTREARRFAEAFDDDEADPAPIVIPKPAWGWTILDAIRGRLQRQ